MLPTVYILCIVELNFGSPPLTLRLELHMKAADAEMWMKRPRMLLAPTDHGDTSTPTTTIATPPAAVFVLTCFHFTNLYLYFLRLYVFHWSLW